jgi:hypothetical protein
MPAVFSILTGIFTVVAACILSRVSTGLRFKQAPSEGLPKVIGILPYWLPWVGHTLSYAIGGDKYLARCSKKNKQAAFAIILKGKKYTIIMAPSLATQVDDAGGLDMSRDAQRYKLRSFFGDRSTGSNLGNTLTCHTNDGKIVMGNNGILRTKAYLEKMVRGLERTAYNLISFNEAWIDQSSWEKTSKTIVHEGRSPVAKASFFPLIESYIGEISVTCLLGKDFLDNNPHFLDDLRLWNSKGTSFMNQTPLFLPHMSAAAAARERLLRALNRFRNKFSAYAAGEDPGSDWNDLSDVSPFISERWNAQSRHSSTQPDVSVDAALLWAFNKPNTLISWLLYRVYSDAALLEELRKEIEPFVQVEHIQSDLPIAEPPRVKINAEGLVEKSVLLREVMNETIRLNSSTVTTGIATKLLVLTESQDDATNLGKEKPDSYVLHQGELVCVPHRAQQMCQGFGDGPGTFNPAGFNSIANLKVPSAKVPGTSGASYAFGVQGVTCPGRELAEQEIMIIAAVILSMWEVDGTWKWPGQRSGLCSTLPMEDVRVRISRRKSAL